MAEPPNLVLQVNVYRSTLLVCIILFMLFIVEYIHTLACYYMIPYIYEETPI